MTITIAKREDGPAICRLMAEAFCLLKDPSWYCTDTEEYIMEHLENPRRGVVFKASEEGKLAGFFLIHFPEKKEGYPEGTALMDSLAVGPAFRGQGLQRELLKAGEIYLSSTSYRRLEATVHPENRYSLNNFLSLGYHIRSTELRYGGLPRHVLQKDLGV